jgi:hypothetical protein
VAVRVVVVDHRRLGRVATVVVVPKRAHTGQRRITFGRSTLYQWPR